MSMRINSTNPASSDALTDLMSSDLMAGGGTEMVVAQAAAQLDDVRQRSRAASRESRSAERQAERSQLKHERKAAALKLLSGLIDAGVKAGSAAASLGSTSAGAQREHPSNGQAPAGAVDTSPSPGGANQLTAPAPSTSPDDGAAWSGLATAGAQLSTAVLGHFQSNQERAAEAAGFEARADKDAAQQEDESAQSADQAVTRALNHADQIAELIHRARMAEISG